MFVARQIQVSKASSWDWSGISGKSGFSSMMAKFDLYRMSTKQQPTLRMDQPFLLTWSWERMENGSVTPSSPRQWPWRTNNMIRVSWKQLSTILTCCAKQHTESIGLSYQRKLLSRMIDRKLCSLWRTQSSLCLQKVKEFFRGLRVGSKSSFSITECIPT